MIGNIASLFYPPHCHVCAKKTGLWNQNLCKECLKKIKKRVPPFCIKCGRLLPREVEIETCSDCKNAFFYFDRALSVSCYEGVLKEAVHNFKYKKMTCLAKEFVELILDFMEAHEVGKGTDLVVPIPMHPLRLLKREINPSCILAKNIAKRLGFRYSTSLLKKTKNTKAQSKLPRSERIKNIKASFSIDQNKIPGVQQKKILLVDDLFTTGSTVNECAKILKGAGSRYVEVITLARGDTLQ